ncbi:MAG: glycosyltransferase family 4 protein [Arenicella sp.]|nr:glycosyltransferase family 4 protein [Arenicella sp.]
MTAKITKITLGHYRCFDADKRMSMEIFADSLAAVVDREQYALQTIRPRSMLEHYSSNRFAMRYLRYWHYPQMAKSISVDLHHVLDHGYAHLCPSLKAANGQSKTCITVHDLIPMLTWNGRIRSANGNKISGRKPWLNLKSLSHLANYDRIIAISLSTKNDLIDHLGLAAEKIDIIPPVIDDIFKPSEEPLIDDFADKYHLDRDCKWLMVSGSEYYKNHRTCLQVLAELNRQHDTEFRLIKTGFLSSDFNAMVTELGLEAQVRSIYLDDISEMVQLYGLIDCLLFPSIYEGFGMPVAEALACGTPVVTSNRGALPEVAGKLAPTCDAGDVQALSLEVASMVFDRQRQEQIASSGPVWIKRFRQAAIKPKLENFYHATLNY